MPFIYNTKLAAIFGNKANLYLFIYLFIFCRAKLIKITLFYLQ